MLSRRRRRWVNFPFLLHFHCSSWGRDDDGDEQSFLSAFTNDSGERERGLFCFFLLLTLDKKEEDVLKLCFLRFILVV